MNKRNLVLSAVVSAVIGLAGCGDKADQQNAASQTAQKTETAQKQEVVKIAYLPITHSLAALQAAEESAKENLQGFRIELVKFGSWPELLDALNTGRVDGAVVLVELAMKAKEQGIPLKAVALGHRDGNVLIGSSELGDFAAIKGQTVAIPHRQSSHHILLQEALEKNNLSVSDIKITELAPTEMPSALSAKQVGGYCVAEPFGAVAAQMGFGKVLYSSEELWPDSICCGLVFTEAFIKDHKELLSKVLKHYKQAGNHLVDKKAALELAKKYFKQKAEVLELSLKWIRFDNLDLTKESYDTLASKVVKYGLSENPPKYEDFVENDL